jgi:mRNA interferase RelE/StbE
MAYQLIIRPSAEKSLDAVPLNSRIRILDATDQLKVDPRPVGCEKLSGTDDELWRIRVGQYRVVYEIKKKELIVLVVRVAHRKDVYRGL